MRTCERGTCSAGLEDEGIASRDGVRIEPEVVETYQQNWQCPYPLKYCFEAQQGAAYARKRAVAEAKGRLIGFLDDDNYPVSNWVYAAYAFGEKYPKAGAYGSQIHPDWEVEPPENFQRIAPFLAITERGNLPLLYEAAKKLLPPSAGLVVRKQAWLESVPDKSILTGRVKVICLPVKT